MSKCLDINGEIYQKKTQAFLNRNMSYSNWFELFTDTTNLHNNYKILITQLLGE